MVFKAVFELLAMFLQVVGQAKPFDRQQEHPVNSLLQGLVTAVILVELAHSLFAVTQVKGFLLVNFDKGTLPRAEGGALIHIPKQGIACTIIESIGYNEFYPAVQGNIKAIGLLEITWI